MVSKEELYTLLFISIKRFLFFSLRIALINDSKAVRAAGLRIIRLCLKNEEYAQKLVQADLHYFIAKYFKGKYRGINISYLLVL